jgi:hypothetical protein
MLLNGWHSDATGERRWHAAIPVVCAGIAYLILALGMTTFPVAMMLFALGGNSAVLLSGLLVHADTRVERVGGGGLRCADQLDGADWRVRGPYVVGYLNDRPAE